MSSLFCEANTTIRSLLRTPSSAFTDLLLPIKRGDHHLRENNDVPERNERESFLPLSRFFGMFLIYFLFCHGLCRLKLGKIRLLKSFFTIDSVMATLVVVPFEGASNITSSIISSMIALRALAPMRLFIAALAMSFSAGSVKSSFTPSIASSFFVLLYQRVPGFLQYPDQRLFVQRVHTATAGSLPMISGMNPNFRRSSGRTCSRTSTRTLSFNSSSPLNPIPSFSYALFDYAFKPVESSARDEKYIGCIKLDEFLLGMFSSSLRRNVRDRAFQKFQQGLLDALPRKHPL